MIKKILGVIGALIALYSLSACDKVPAGNVGIKVYLLGGDKGVDTEELGAGRYWIGINEELHLFPTFTQNTVWTRDSKEGSENDESISFQTVEGLKVDADIGVSYAIQPDKVNSIFQKYRRGIDEITDTFLRNMVRDALVTASSTIPMESVYGVGKADLMSRVEKIVREQVAPLGITVERIYWIGSLRLPPAVETALNAKLEATQKASQRQNEIATAIAEADKKVAKARGEAESILQIANAEAKAIKLKGDALAKNPLVVRLTAIEKWNGQLPRVSSGAVPFINVGAKDGKQ